MSLGLLEPDVAIAKAAAAVEVLLLKNGNNQEQSVKSINNYITGTIFIFKHGYYTFA